jgi:hypothetical protein
LIFRLIFKPQRIFANQLMLITVEKTIYHQNPNAEIKFNSARKA